MALAVQTQVSDGTLTSVQVGIDFFEQEDIMVYLDLASSPLVQGEDYAWSADKTITFYDAPLANGVVVFLVRQTQIDEMLNIYDGGAGFTRYTLDENFKQILLLAQEVREGVGLRGVFLPLDMNGYQIQNLGAATNSAGAASLGQVQDLDAAVTAAYQAADVSLQAQINGTTPPLASAFSPISWHGQEITNSIVIPDNVNAWSFGPEITITEGAEITIGTGSYWTIAAGAQTQEGPLVAALPEVDDAGVLP